MKFNQLLIMGALVGFAVAVRLVFHLPNATPLTAIAFVSSLYFGRRYAILLPLLALFLSDLVIGFYDWRIMLSVYGSFALIGVVSFAIKKYPGVLSGAALVFASSLFFFVVTNFAVWIFSPWYAKSIEGLLYCYTLGLPFYRNMLLGDALYTPLLFGVFGYGAHAAKYVAGVREQFASRIKSAV